MAHCERIIAIGYYVALKLLPTNKIRWKTIPGKMILLKSDRFDGCVRKKKKYNSVFFLLFSMKLHTMNVDIFRFISKKKTSYSFPMLSSIYNRTKYWVWSKNKQLRWWQRTGKLEREYIVWFRSISIEYDNTNPSRVKSFFFFLLSNASRRYYWLFAAHTDNNK